MFERFSEQAANAVRSASNTARTAEHPRNAADLLRALLEQSNTAARGLLDTGAININGAGLSGQVTRAVSRAGGGSEIRLERCVKRAVEISRERGDRNVTTAHLLVAVADLANAVCDEIKDKLRDGLDAFVNSEPAAGLRPCKDAAPLRGDWARSHLSSGAYRVLQLATEDAVKTNEGIIEPEHIQAALEMVLGEDS